MTNGDFIEINIPKNIGKGEDAPPLCLSFDNKGVCGVFDGLGGAGASVYNEDGVPRTGAFIGANLVKDVCEVFFTEILGGRRGDDFDGGGLHLLKKSINDALQERLKQHSITPSKLRSSLIRTFPTTLALGLWDVEDDHVNIISLWVGDSRVYAISPDIGLIQLTDDDLKMANDPMENIFKDSPMSNVIQADMDFQINVNEFSVKFPTVVLSSTDGCFGYFPTPMHFEDALLGSLLKSESISDWQENMAGIIRGVTGDDFSMAAALIVPNGLSFESFKDLFLTRHKYLQSEYIEGIQSLYDEISILKEVNDISEEVIREKEECLKEEKFKLWLKYKKSYMLKNYYA
jgi:serine/threonine protein phosphatase PrpC